MGKYIHFICTIWEDGTIILTERITCKNLKIKKNEKDISKIKVGKSFKGNLEELTKNYQNLFKEG